MKFALFDIITIGYPFCVFKIITGLHLNMYPLIVLGAIDLFINSINLIHILIKKQKLDTCFLAFFTRKIFKAPRELKRNWQELGESLDVALSFILVAYIIGSGEITQFNSLYLVFWNWSVVFNVLGAGLSRIIHSVSNIKKGSL